jgi:hypothetical protein
VARLNTSNYKDRWSSCSSYSWFLVHNSKRQFYHVEQGVLHLPGHHKFYALNPLDDDFDFVLNELSNQGRTIRDFLNFVCDDPWNTLNMSTGFVPEPENFSESLNACFLASGGANTNPGYATGLSFDESFIDLAVFSKGYVCWYCFVELDKVYIKSREAQKRSQF